MEVKVDPGSETNCIPLSHFRHLFPQLCRKDGTPKGECPGTNSGSVWSIWWWHHDQPQMDHTASSRHQRQQQVSSCEITMWCPGRRPGFWSVMLQQLGWDSWRSYVQTRCPGVKRQVASVSKNAREPLDSSNSNSLSGPEHPPKVKYFYNNNITTPQHPPKVKYTGTVTVNEQQHEKTNF